MQAWRAAGGTSDEIERWYEKRISAAAFNGRLGDGEWVQADFLVTLIHRALNKTIVSYLDDEWRPDFKDFRFILDAKLTGKLAKGEKYLTMCSSRAAAAPNERIGLRKIRCIVTALAPS